MTITEPPNMPIMAARQRRGKPVYFADACVWVMVTEADLDAKPMNATDCAFAHACKRALTGCIAAEIGRAYSFVEYETHIFKYRTSEPLSRQFTSFDQGGKFLPGAYELMTVPMSNRLPRVQGKRRGSGNGNIPTLRLGPSSVRQLAP